jgi:hypothetical protein
MGLTGGQARAGWEPHLGSRVLGTFSSAVTSQPAQVEGTFRFVLGQESPRGQSLSRSPTVCHQSRSLHLGPVKHVKTAVRHSHTDSVAC